MTDFRRLAEEIAEHLRFYGELGIRWISTAGAGDANRGVLDHREKSPPTAATGLAQALQVLPRSRGLFEVVPGKEESLGQIRQDLGECQRCKLAPTRMNIVFGVGNPRAELLFVGEAPGKDEDEQGLPFVGRAGQLLTRIIESMGMTRDDVYICNILKCRPPGNRNPEPDEIAACEPFLLRQIDAVAPKVICALGAFGARTLFQTREPISRIRGKLIDYRGAKLIATFHPAYLLRNPNEKRRVWEDVLKIRNYLRSPVRT